MIIPVFVLVILDEWIKFWGVNHLPDENAVANRFLGFGIHKNWGLAFDIPFKKEFIILFSLLLGYYLVKIAIDNRFNHPMITFSSLIIIAGATGNLFDRLFHGFTVDYIIFFQRSAINLCDLFIILGAVLLLISSRKLKINQLNKTDLDKV